VAYIIEFVPFLPGDPAPLVGTGRLSGGRVHARLRTDVAGQGTGRIVGVRGQGALVTDANLVGTGRLAGVRSQAGLITDVSLRTIARVGSMRGRGALTVEGGGGGALAFGADWRTGTGTGTPALTDNGRFSGHGSTTNLSVVTTASVGGTWPTGMTNALRVMFNNAQFGSVWCENLWTLPAEGEYLYRRTCMRASIPTSSGDSHHPVQSMAELGGTCPFAAEYVMTHGSGNWTLQLAYLNTSNPGFDGDGGNLRACRFNLGGTEVNDTVYQIEERFFRVPGFSTRWWVEARVYDVAGTLIATGTNFTDENHSNATMPATFNGTRYVFCGTGSQGETCLRQWNWGNQGKNYGAGAALYFGGIAVRLSASADDWIGPYNVSQYV
jgi:hypothetical protein